MAVLATGNTFSTGDQVTAATLNAAVNSATFAAGAVDDSTIQLSGGALRIKDGGVTPAKLSTGAPSWVSGGDLTVKGTTIVRDVSTDELVLYGGATDGANINLLGGSHPTNANELYFDAAKHYFRSQSGTQRAVLDSSGNLGVGETAPSAKLHVTGGSGTLPTISADTHLIVEGTDGNAEVSILADTAGKSILNFGSETDEDIAHIEHDHNTSKMTLECANIMSIEAGGTVLIDVSTVGSSFKQDFNLASPTVPASAAASGIAGDIAWDANYIYVCTATNTWKRTSISTW